MYLNRSVLTGWSIRLVGNDGTLGVIGMVGRGKATIKSWLVLGDGGARGG